MGLQCQRDLFQLSDEVVYLNCAYMSPQLKAVEASGRDALRLKNQPWLISPDDFFRHVEALKQAFARTVNIAGPGRIALQPSVSYGMAVVAANLPLDSGQNIIVAADQFPSNYYTWERLCRERGAELRVVAAPPAGPQRTDQWNERLLEAVDGRTALLALGNIHWADGTLFDLPALRRRTREVGAWLVIDGTQSVGALPFDVSELQPDALVVAGYKWLMGPYSIALSYYGPALDEGKPIEENWINRLDSHDFRNLVSYQPAYQPLAGRYSAGEHSNFLLVPMQRTALDQLNAWGIAGVQDYCRRLVAPFVPALEQMGIQLPDRRAHHLLGLRLDDSFDTERLNVLLQQRRIFVSFRGNAIRVAPNVYNRPEEVEQLVECLQQAHRSTARQF